MKFIIDTQLPPKLSLYLNYLGYESAHTTDYEKGELLKDREIIDIARSESRIIITKDKDFYDSYFVFGAPPEVLLLQVGNLSNDILLNLLRKNINRIVNEFRNGAGLIILTYKDITII